MIQYVTCNKSWLFAPRQKNSKKQRKEKYPSGTRKKFKCFLINFSNSFLYEIEAWTTLQCNLNWIQIHWMEFEFNLVIGLRFNWK